jgi:hypothetical protein
MNSCIIFLSNESLDIYTGVYHHIANKTSEVPYSAFHLSKVSECLGKT